MRKLVLAEILFCTLLAACHHDPVKPDFCAEQDMVSATITSGILKIGSKSEELNDLDVESLLKHLDMGNRIDMDGRCPGRAEQINSEIKKIVLKRKESIAPNLRRLCSIQPGEGTSDVSWIALREHTRQSAKKAMAWINVPTDDCSKSGGNEVSQLPR